MLNELKQKAAADKQRQEDERKQDARRAEDEKKQAARLKDEERKAATAKAAADKAAAIKAEVDKKAAASAAAAQAAIDAKQRAEAAARQKVSDQLKQALDKQREAEAKKSAEAKQQELLRLLSTYQPKSVECQLTDMAWGADSEKAKACALKDQQTSRAKQSGAVTNISAPSSKSGPVPQPGGLTPEQFEYLKRNAAGLQPEQRKVTTTPQLNSPTPQFGPSTFAPSSSPPPTPEADTRRSDQTASAATAFDRARGSTEQQNRENYIPMLDRRVPDIHTEQFRADMKTKVVAAIPASSKLPTDQGQCTDYARSLFSNVTGGPKLPSGIGDAKEWFAYARNSTTTKYATAVPGAVSRVPPGSVVVFGATEKNPFGHVAVVKANDGKGHLTVTEMNWGGNFDPVTGRTSNFGTVTERTLNYQDGKLTSSTYPLEGFILPF